MLRIYDDIVSLLTDLRGPIAAVQRHDADLARQLRRAATSVLLNVAEGSGVRAGNRRQRYHTALGSALEVRACLDAGAALGYHGALDPTTAVRLRKVIGTLVRFAR